MPTPSESPRPTTPAVTPVVEAHSMVDLNRLADDPPLRRPDFATSFERRGLLLWIVRVPESKDIILTPLQPVRGSNSATAADIAACMYYLHLHSQSPVMGTLIRRAPGSGDQWNVANIVASPGEEGQVTIEMLGDGYRKFSGDAGVPSERPQIERKPVPGTVPNPAVIDEPAPLLTRVMHVEGAGFWDRIKSRRKKSAESRIEKPPPSAIAAETGGRVKKKRDYVFDGLWTDASSGVSAGRCEFKGEGGGKYLKCKYYPNPSSSSGGEQEKSTLLSVIEFKTSSLVHQHKRSISRSSSASDDDDSKQKAKMGMLVVHGPGHEMLDLLVAANIAAFMKRRDGWAKERVALGGF